MTLYDTNQLHVSGFLKDDPVKSHVAYGEEFLSFDIMCRRLSGTYDQLPVLAPAGMAGALRAGANYGIMGQLRSYNEYSETGTHLRLKIFAKKIMEVQKTDLNTVILEGHVCKDPVYRITPFGREIADLLLAVNRAYGKSDYIPIIVWGKNARFARQLKTGQKIRIEGRFQSRVYEKTLDEGKAEKRMAYEVSACAIYMIL